MPARTTATYVVLSLVLGTVAVVAVLVGQGSLADPTLKATLLELRATRVAAAALAGAALGVAGAVVQGVFRNPLVSPSILGTTAGASLGGQLGLVALALGLGTGRFGLGAAEIVVPLGCLVGATMALALVLSLCRDRTESLALLLTGFVLSALFLALGSFVTSFAQDSWELGRAVVSFTLGGVGGVGRRQLLMAVPLAGAGIAAAWLWGRTLDVLLSGEEEAATLGVNVAQVRRWSVIWVAVLTASAASIGGSVAFVGLIEPHVLRPFVGVTHRRLIPAAALLGAAFLVACDVIARMIPARSEVPLGVITGLIGAPVFLILLVRTRRELAHG